MDVCMSTRCARCQRRDGQATPGAGRWSYMSGRRCDGVFGRDEAPRYWLREPCRRMPGGLFDVRGKTGARLYRVERNFFFFWKPLTVCHLINFF